MGIALNDDPEGILREEMRRRHAHLYEALREDVDRAIVAVARRRREMLPGGL